MRKLTFSILAACGLAMAQPECSLQTLRGTYITSYAGFVSTPTATVYVAILGVISIDPSKTPSISGGITFTGFGPTPMFVPATGTVQVNPDCTGVMTIGNPATGQVEVDQFIYDRDARTLHAVVIRTAVGNVASLGTGKQISAVPGAATWQAPPKP